MQECGRQRDFTGHITVFPRVEGTVLPLFLPLFCSVVGTGQGESDIHRFAGPRVAELGGVVSMFPLCLVGDSGATMDSNTFRIFVFSFFKKCV